MGLFALVVACTKGDGDGKDRRPPVETDDTATVVDTGDYVNARPLCLEDAPPAAVPADIAAWVATLGPSANRYYGKLEWEALEALGDDLGPTDERAFSNQITRGWHRLKFGDQDGAIADFEAAEQRAIAMGEGRYRGRAREMLGIAWMRKAETENCLNGGASSCIVPFDDAATHHDPTGMENAAAAFQRALEQDLPDHTSLRWLYNVTFMARGGWPQDVPADWRLPEDFLDTEGPAAAFTNHAPGLTLARQTLAGGTSIEDFDGDGLLDVMTSTMDPSVGMDLFLAMGDGRFCRGSEAAGLSAQVAVLDFKVADYDNDGDLDVAAPRAAWQQSYGTVRMSLLRNDGQGHFEDVTLAAGLADPVVNGPTQVAMWADVDNDGLLDLFVGREDDEASPLGRRISSLYHNHGDGTFDDIGSEAGVSSSGFVKGASFLDFDDDGDVDLYASSLKGSDRFYVNDGTGHFLEQAEELGIVLPIKSFASAALDYDQDGRQDLFVAAFTNNYAGGGPMEPDYFQSAESYVDDKLGNPTDPLFSETAHLYRNTGGAFEDVTLAVGLDDIHATMGLSFGDFDMDGYPDLFYGTGAPEYDALEPNTAYRNDAGARFLDVTAATRTGHLQKGHGVAFADLDEDGDEDFFVELGGAFPGDVAPSALFRNPTNDGRATRQGTTLRLEGVTANRSAIGARVAAVTPGRTFHYTVGETGSFGGNSLQVEVQLADETELTRVEIRWPGGETETIRNVPLGNIVTIRQGDGIVDATPWRFLPLQGGEDHHAHE